MEIKFIPLIFISVLSLSCQNSTPRELDNKNTTSKNLIKKNNTNSVMDNTYNKSDAQWKNILSPEQYEVLRQKGTEKPFTGKYNLTFDKGKYVCAGCSFELFSSESKFESHCGWPSFDQELLSGNIKTKTDVSFGMSRTEIMCGRCGGHLGHVFDDGPTKTGLRYCVNSISIQFKEEEKK